MCCSANAELRTWTDHSGKISFAAEMIAASDESVRLRLRKDNSEYDVPLRVLSSADREFVKAARVSRRIPANGIPDETLKRIKADAQRKWPGDFSMQEFQVANEKAAFLAIDNYQNPGIPRAVFERILIDARRKWSTTYEMQKFEIDNQINAYHAVQTYSAPEIPSKMLGEIISRAKQKWEGNYEMQQWEIDQQVESYINLNR